MIDFIKKDSYDIKDLARIVSILRGPGGCPWDGEQTHASLRRGLIEESYEVIEAINAEDPEHLKEELGDLLLQVVFHADIEKDAGRFTLDDVADGICKKLIFRHPHVFGEVQVTCTDEVLVNWEELKRKEKGQESYTDTLNAVARTLPGLWRAEKVQNKAKKAGFDWGDYGPAMDKLSEEYLELKKAIQESSNIAEELGDLLFAAVNVSRFVGVDPEEALNGATEKFISRFAKVERLARESGRDMAQMGLSELEALWEMAKRT